MGGAESALLDPVPVDRAVAARLADYEIDGALPRRDCAQAWRRARGRQGQALSGALARVLDRPCARRQFRCAGRDEETAARPNKETGRPGLRDRRGMTSFEAGRPRLPLGG